VTCEGHVYVTLLNFGAAMIYLEPLNLESSILQTGRIYQVLALE